MANKKKSIIPTIILTVICILWLYPILLILLNSLKVESAITTSGVFSFPTAETWNGISNFIASVTQMDFLKSFWYSLVISVMSVVLILICCSHERMVYRQGKRKTFQSFLLPLRVQYGGTFPDGNVHSGENSGHAEAE